MSLDVPKRQVPCTTIHPFDVTIAMHVVRFCAQVTPIRHPRPSNCAKQILTAAQPITMYVYVIVTKYVLCRILKHDSFNVDPLRLLSHALLVIVSANMFFANSDSLSSFEIFSENSPHLRWCRILLKTHMVYWTYRGTETLNTLNANSIRAYQVSKDKLWNRWFLQDLLVVVAAASAAMSLTPKVNHTHILPPC